MKLINLLQGLATLVSAREAMAVVMLTAAVGTGICAHFRAPTGLRRYRPAIGAAAIGAVVLLLAPRGVMPGPLTVALILAVVAGFVLHSVAEIRNPGDHIVETPARRRGNIVWIGSALVLTLLFLFTNLGSYTGTLLVWEPESMSGLVEASTTGVPFSHFAAARLLWDDGLVSSGHHSFLYGTGTYALWRLVGASPTTLRLMAALLALACLPAAYAVGKAVGGRRVATAAVVAMAISPVLIFYGRYGTSLSGSLFAVLLVIWGCACLIEPTENRWWIGLAAAGAVYLATLGYSPGRVVTAAVVMTTVAFAAWSWRRLAPGRRGAFLVMMMALAGVWLVQASFDTSQRFARASGEQALTLFSEPERVEAFLGREDDPGRPERRSHLSIIAAVFDRNIPDFEDVLSFPFTRTTSAREVLEDDPPRLPFLQGPLLLLAIWGLVRSLADWRRGWPLLLVAAAAAATLPLFLTTRIDMHRMVFASLPLVIWVALGIVAADGVARACGVPAVARHTVAALLVVLIVADNSTFLFYPKSPPRPVLVTQVCSEIDSVSQPVALGLTCDHRWQGEIELALVNRQHIQPSRLTTILPEETVNWLTQEPSRDRGVLAQIERELRGETLILAPRGPFLRAVDVLEKRGASVREIGDTDTGLWRIEGADDDGSRIGHDSRNPSPTATSTWLDKRRRPLTEEDEIDTEYSFEGPRFDRTWDDDLITMGGMISERGIGMHAWTRMRVAVPAGAIGLEAIIGLSDKVLECDEALVTFEVWNENQELIFDSGVIGPRNSPQLARVVLGPTAYLDLVVTEAGNGRDCDHGNWAEASFVLDEDDSNEE